MSSNQAAARTSRSAAVLVLVWLVAVPAAAGLGVLALRAAGGDSSQAVISSAQAAALATETPAQPSPAPSPIASPRDSPTDTSGTVERRVPGAVLGLRCEQGVPVLEWSVPDVGWRIEDVEYDDGAMRLRIESGDDEVRVDVVCTDGTPRVAQATRGED